MTKTHCIRERLWRPSPFSVAGEITRGFALYTNIQHTQTRIQNVLFYYVYALLKIAVIVQQIYARYKAGFTRDERFAHLIYAVRVLGRTAVLALEKGRIDDLAAG